MNSKKIKLKILNFDTYVLKYLDQKNLIILNNLSNQINFKVIILDKLYKNC